MATNKYGVVQKNWLTAFILSLFFGWLGADRFYLGKAGTAVLKLLTLGGLGIWALIDFILIATQSMKGVEWTSGNTKKDKKIASIIFGAALLLGIIIAATASGGSNKTANNTSPASSNSTSTSQPAQQAETKPAENKEPAVPAEYKSALAKAKQYSDTMHMSKQGIYDQLVSDYGEKFKPEAARYAVDNLKTDYNANALAKAKDYQKTMNMSPSAIHDQLTSASGEKFTQAEADYAIQHLTK